MAHSVFVSLSVLVAYCYCFASIDGASAESPSLPLSLSPVSRTGLLTCDLKPNGCYERCTQHCAPGSCSPRTCEPGCYKKDCKELQELVCKDTCNRSGNCWIKCGTCCYTGGYCIGTPCAPICRAPGCGEIVKLSPPPKPSPKPQVCSWGCKRGGSEWCYMKCRKCCDSKGVCTISNFCTRRCYSPGCDIKPSPKPLPTTLPKKCVATCTRSGICYTRCNKCCDSKGVCDPPACLRACFPKGCGIKPTPKPLPTTPQKICKMTCTGSGGCYLKCQECCDSNGTCDLGFCLLACFPPGCGLPVPQLAK